MKNNIRLFLLVVLISTNTFGQIESTVDPYLLNPSLGGWNKVVKLGTLYQTQMTAYNYHPKSFVAWGSSEFSNQRLAAGCKIASQEGGVLRNISATADLIYYVDIASSKLSFALGGSFNQLQLVRDRVAVRNPNDPLLQGAESGNWFNANFGVSISKVNAYYFGLAAYNLLPKQTNWMVSSFENKAEITYAISGMYTFALLQGDTQLKLSGFAYTNQPENSEWLRYNIGADFMINKSFWLGTGYANNALKGSFGIVVQNLSFGYVGYYSLKKTYNYDMTQHQISLMLELPYSKTSKTLKPVEQ